MNSRSWIRYCDGNGRAFFSTSIVMFPKLFDYLLKENTYACGTVHMNRKEMPASASTKEKLKPGEKVVAKRDQLVYTKWHDKKDVSFLLTNVSPGEPSRLVPRRVKGQDITIKKPRIADVYTKHMSTELISYALSTTWDGNPESCIVISSGSYSISPSAMLMFWSRSIMITITRERSL